MLKTVFQAIGTVLFFAVCAALLLYVVCSDLDKTIAVECSSCSSPFSWCPGYWEEHGLCGRTETDTDGQELVERKVGDE